MSLRASISADKAMALFSDAGCVEQAIVFIRCVLVVLLQWNLFGHATEKKGTVILMYRIYAIKIIKHVKISIIEHNETQTRSMVTQKKEIMCEKHFNI